MKYLETGFENILKIFIKHDVYLSRYLNVYSIFFGMSFI